MSATQQSAAKKRSPAPASPPLAPLDPNRLYKPRNAAPYMDCSVVYVYRLIKAGKLKAVDVGGIKIPGAEIVRLQNAEGAGNA